MDYRLFKVTLTRTCPIIIIFSFNLIMEVNEMLVQQLADLARLEFSEQEKEGDQRRSATHDHLLWKN